MRKSRSSSAQKNIAAKLGIDVSDDTHDVAAARIHDAVATAIGQLPPKRSTARQRKFAEEIGIKVSKDTIRVASARIGDKLSQDNRHALQALNLKPGDEVALLEDFEIDGIATDPRQRFIVSSIGSNGRVYFKGMNCPGAWPSQIKKVSGQLFIQAEAARDSA
ncbi:MAG: hypothetical protein Q8S00_10800 [Deltaproteobacteria bacterium]|nr:hypothetical protein [Deltaproteobacteria bacterium]MDZ4346507.1 hypothetical protein [Candidatus Binatia bacterium]